MAIIGRLLAAQGFRVGIIAQPDWRSKDAFEALGRPNLYFGVAAGNMAGQLELLNSPQWVDSSDGEASVAFELTRQGVSFLELTW
jgi:radical SAM superfamily enzyme YgiQ (UPF0313 family)